MFIASRRLLLLLSVLTILLVRSPLLQAQDLREVATLKDGKPLVSQFAFFMADGKSLVSGDDVGVVNLWDLETKKSKQRWVNKTIDDRFPSVRHAALSPDGKSLVTTVTGGKVADDSGVILFELAAGKRLLRFGPKVDGNDFENGGWPIVAAFSPDGKTLVTGNKSGNLIFWDVTTAKEIVRLSENKQNDDARNIHAVCFSPDGKTLAADAGVITRHDVMSGSMSIWDVTKRQQINSWECHEGRIVCSAFIKDGTTLATGSRDGTVKLWDTATRKEKATLKVGGEVRSMAVSPSGDQLAVGSFARSGDNLYLFDLKSGEKTASKTAHRFQVTSVTFSADGKALATTGGGGDVKLWQVVSGKDK